MFLLLHAPSVVLYLQFVGDLGQEGKNSKDARLHGQMPVHSLDSGGAALHPMLP